MKKTFIVLYFVGCLQLLSFKPMPWGIRHSSTGQGQTYYAPVIRPPKAQVSTFILPPDSVKDIDGHVYPVIKIGKQYWMQENLRTAHFSDGSVIQEMEFNMDWPYTGNRGNRGATGMAAWCYFERSSGYNYPYGKLYNWYAIADPHNVCPAGWHVPSDEDFQILSDDLGGDSISGTHMKPIKIWKEYHAEYADNASGFNALPAGIRYRGGSYDRAGADGADFWTSSSYGRHSAVCRSLYYGGSNFGHSYLDRRSGLSVRCVKN